MSKGLMQRATWRSSTLVLFESSLIVGALLVVGSAQLDTFRASDQLLPRVLLFAYAAQLAMYYGDLYDHPGVMANRRELVGRVLQALGVASVMLAVIYFWFPQMAFAHTVFPVAAFAVGGTVIGWRLVFAWVTQQVGPRERLLLVGSTVSGHELARELGSRPELGVRICGYADAQAPEGETWQGKEYLGAIDDIPTIIHTHAIDRVVLSLADARGKLPMDKLLDMKLEGVTFDHLASVYEEYTGKIAVENLRPSWLIFSSGFRASAKVRVAKRLMDVATALPGLLLSAPVILVAGVAIKLTSPGPVFYSQVRVGQGGKLFTVRKLRSMRADAERHTGAVWAARHDDRVTPLGRFMRSTRLDELPQFWNVLAGHMSLVGPRPERPEFVSSLTREIRFYGLRHSVKPGITGWAQVRYTYGASVEDAMQKLQYDLYYIKNLSLWFDVFILFETFKTVLLRRGL